MDWLTLNGAVRLLGALTISVACANLVAPRLRSPKSWAALVALALVGAGIFTVGWLRLLPE